MVSGAVMAGSGDPPGVIFWMPVPGMLNTTVFGTGGTPGGGTAVGKTATSARSAGLREVNARVPLETWIASRSESLASRWLVSSAAVLTVIVIDRSDRGSNRSRAGRRWDRRRG